jgi:hypothetical protein
MQPPVAQYPPLVGATPPFDTEEYAARGRGHRRWLRVLALIAAALLIALVAGGVAAALRQNDLNKQQDRADTAVRRSDALKASSQEQARRIAALQAQLNARQVVIANQNRQLGSLRQAQAAAKRQQAALDKRQQQLDQRENALNARANTLNQEAQQQQQQTQNTVAPPSAPTQSTTFGDGLYQVGTDIPAGTYSTAGGPTCYWATLSDSNANSILDDHSGPGPQTVTVNAPYFASNACGTWTKVG